jgi:proline iminopeptidase
MLSAIGSSPSLSPSYQPDTAKNSGTLPHCIEYIPLDIGFQVWTQRIGTGPKKMLLLHGGPGFSHEYLESFSKNNNLPLDQYEIIFYDQLGSFNSDKPNDPSLWTLERFGSELEQVINHLGLDQFVLFGHSWGGMLAIEYALKHPEKLKGMIISSMTASITSYISYIKILREKLPPSVEERLQFYEESEDYENPDYQELLFKEFYSKHICLSEPWPEEAMRAMQHLNKSVLYTIQGPNEVIFNGNAREWNRWDDLKHITSPVLVVSGSEDTMNPEDSKRMAEELPNAQCQILVGGHLTFSDNPTGYFAAIQEFTDTLYS